MILPPILDQNSTNFRPIVNSTKIFDVFSTNYHFDRMLHSTNRYIRPNGFRRNVMEAFIDFCIIYFSFCNY